MKIFSEKGSKERLFEMMERVNKVTLNEVSGEQPSFDQANNAEYTYNNKGTWIPKGLEDKRSGIKVVEQPIGSGNEKFLVVLLDANGETERILSQKDTWDEAKSALADGLT